MRLVAIGDAALLAAAGERVATIADGDADGLRAAARQLAAFVARQSAAGTAAVRAAGALLLERAVAAGADRATLAADAELQPLLGAFGH